MHRSHHVPWDLLQLPPLSVTEKSHHFSFGLLSFHTKHVEQGRKVFFFHVAAVWLHECAQAILAAAWCLMVACAQPRRDSGGCIRLCSYQDGHIYRTVGPQSAAYSGLSLQPVLEKGLPEITLPQLKSIFERNRKKVLPLILRKTHYSQPPFTEFWYGLFVMYHLSCASVLHAWPRVFLTEFWVASAVLPYRWWHRGHTDSWALHRSQRWVWGFLVVHSSAEGIRGTSNTRVNQHQLVLCSPVR